LGGRTVVVVPTTGQTCWADMVMVELW
jgi:hypothetical protein